MNDEDRHPGAEGGSEPAAACPGTSDSPDVLDTFDWPAEPTLEALGKAIAVARGLGIVIRSIPEHLSHYEISGLTAVVGQIAHVFYDAKLSPLNREQTILHEYAHILHSDVMADRDRTHRRSMFDDPAERGAETTGMRLLEELHRRRRLFSRRGEPEVLGFFSGSSMEGGQQ